MSSVFLSDFLLDLPKGQRLHFFLDFLFVSVATAFVDFSVSSDSEFSGVLSSGAESSSLLPPLSLVPSETGSSAELSSLSDFSEMVSSNAVSASLASVSFDSYEIGSSVFPSSDIAPPLKATPKHNKHANNRNLFIVQPITRLHYLMNLFNFS